MTIEDIEESLQNGFHDSRLCGFEVDLQNQTAVLKLEIDTGESFSKARLTVKGLTLWVMEAPDRTTRLTDFACLETSGFPTTTKIFPEMKGFEKTCSSTTFFYSFFLRSLNCFVHIAAETAELEFVR